MAQVILIIISSYIFIQWHLILTDMEKNGQITIEQKIAVMVIIIFILILILK